MQPGQPKDFITEMKHQFNVMLGLAQIVSFPVVLCTTRFGTWGSRYLTASSVMGFFWPPVFTVFCGRDPRIIEVFQFWGLCFILLIIHRIAGIARRRRGYRVHSRYWGTSWLDFGKNQQSQKTAIFLETLVVLTIGIVFIKAGSVPLGALLVIGCIGKVISEVTEYQAVEARLQSMEDARIENEFYQSLFQQRQS